MPRSSSAFTSALLVATAVAFALFSNAFTPVNTDLGWLLAFGRDTVASGEIQHLNPQSFTEPQHTVVRHEWLLGVLLYGVHRTFGAAGLIAAKWVLVGFAVIGLGWLITSVSRRRASAALVLLLAVHSSWMGYELLRAQLVSLALLPLAIGAVLAERRALLWTLVPLFALWANLHGGWVAAWLVCAGMSVVLLVERRLGWSDRASDVRTVDLVGAPMGAAVATLLTPYGASLHRAVIFNSIGEARTLAREWLPLWHFSELVPVEWWGLGWLAATTTFALLFLPRRQLRYWALLAGALMMSISSSRHLRLAPILLGPVVLLALDRIMDRLPAATTKRLERSVAPAMAALALLFGCLFASAAPDAMHFIDYPRAAPANALAVMHANDLHGRVWNDFDWGGLMLWAVPESRVAADGRSLTAYSPDVLRTNVVFGGSREDPLVTVDRFGADMALLPPGNPAVRRLATRFDILYCDRDACLLSSKEAHRRKAAQGLVIPATPLRPSDLYENRRGPWADLVAARTVRPGTGAQPEQNDGAHVRPRSHRQHD